jgi:hypothetical protein
MTIPIRYAFNSGQLLALIARQDCKKVVFSFCTIKKPTENESYMYAYAEALNEGDDPITGQGAYGCPTPPGWGGDDEPPVGPLNVGTNPQFVIQRGVLEQYITQNEMEGPQVNELHVELVGENSDEGLNSVVYVLCLFADGREKIPPAKAASFFSMQTA